jgi:hypothetical protein
MKTMDLQALIEALDRWGADLSSWPESQAKAAAQLINESEAARIELASAQRVQQLLDSLPVVSAPGALKSAIISAPPADRWQQFNQWITAALWRPALAGALSLLLGFGLGFTATGGESVDDPRDDVSLLAFLSSYEAYVDEDYGLQTNGPVEEVNE